MRTNEFFVDIFVVVSVNLDGTVQTRKKMKHPQNFIYESADVEESEEDDDWSAEAQGFDFDNPREWMESMNLADEDGSYNDDGYFGGHDYLD